MHLFLVLSLFSVLIQNLCGQNLPNGCQEAFRKAALNAHNKFRARHRAPPLQIDSSLDTYALKWSQYLAKNDVFKHSGFGENLHVRYGGSLSTPSQCAGKIKEH
jgi:glioma pathogenesis-related protein 2